MTVTNTVDPSELYDVHLSNGLQFSIGQPPEVGSKSQPFIMALSPTVTRQINARGIGHHLANTIKHPMGTSPDARDVPIGSKLSNKVAWLSGFINGLAVVKREGNGGQYLSMSCSDVRVLHRIRLLLLEMAVDSGIEIESSSDTDKPQYRLVLNVKSCLQLLQLGVEFTDAALNFKIQDVYAYKPVEVVSVSGPREVSDVAYITYAIRHTIVIDGMMWDAI